MGGGVQEGGDICGSSYVADSPDVRRNQHNIVKQSCFN